MPEIWFPNLGIEIESLSRIAFEFMGNGVYWYGITMSIAFVIGTLLCMKEFKRLGINPDLFMDFMIYAFFIAFICARLYYVAFSWENYKDNLLSIFALREGGIAIYGGIIGGFLTSVWYSKRQGFNLYAFLDVASIGLVAGQVIGRIGNFINREAFGGYTNGFFSMRLKSDTVSTSYLTQELVDNIITVNNVEYIQVHPTFLYEMLWNICVFILLNIFKKRKKFNGQLVLIYFTFYGIGRFWIEGLRTDQLKFSNSDIAVSQVLSLVLAFSSVIALFVLIRKDLELKPILEIANEDSEENTEENLEQCTEEDSEESIEEDSE